MPEFTNSFFEYHKPLLTTNEQETIGVKLDLADLKQVFLVELVTGYLETNFEDSQMNKIHYANGLINSIAQNYGIPEIKDSFVHQFAEIELEAFKRFVEKHFNVANFIRFVRTQPQCPQLPDKLVAIEDATYGDKINQITAFFDWLGEKDIPDNGLQKIYQKELDEKSKRMRLTPKKDFHLWVDLLLAEYLEKANYVDNLSIKIGNWSLVDNGESLVQLTKEGYQSLSQKDIIAILNEGEYKIKKSQLARLLEQLHPELLFERYFTLDTSINEDLYFKVLLKEPSILKLVPLVVKANRADVLEKFVVKANRADVLEKFNELGVDFDKPDQTGKTILHSAAEQGCLNVVEKLIQLGADPNQPDNSKWTPLHFAAYGGQVRVIKKLKELGANFNHDGNRTPADIAANIGYLDALETLHKFGDKFNLPKLFENWPKNEKKKFVQWLVAKLPNVVQNIDDFLLIINELSDLEKAKFATQTLEFLIERKEYDTATSIVKLFPEKDIAEQSKASGFKSLFCGKRSKTTLFKCKAISLSEQSLTQLNQHIHSGDTGFNLFKKSSMSSDAKYFKQLVQQVGIMPTNVEEQQNKTMLEP